MSKDAKWFLLTFLFVQVISNVVDLVPCSKGDPCVNGGTCELGACICTSLFYGHRCHHRYATSVSCQQGRRVYNSSYNAPTCTDCPQGKGAISCNGDCTWFENKCVQLDCTDSEKAGCGSTDVNCCATYYVPSYGCNDYLTKKHCKYSCNLCDSWYDKYTYLESTACLGDRHLAYLTLQQAKNGCGYHKDCNCIDYKRNQWATYNGKSAIAPRGSFSWVKLPKALGAWKNYRACIATGKDPACGNGTQIQRRDCEDGAQEKCSAMPAILTQIPL